MSEGFETHQNNENTMTSTGGIEVVEHDTEDIEEIVLETDPAVLEERIEQLTSELKAYEGVAVIGKQIEEIERMAKELTDTQAELKLLKLKKTN